MRGAPSLLAAFLELTYDCNFACPHCYNDVRSRAELDTAAWMGVLGRLAELSCLELVFSGGEPLLREDILELSAHARALRFSLRIITNGSAFDDEMVSGLVRIKPTAVGVTLYGFDDATYARVAAVRGGWEAVREGVARAVAAGLPIWPRMLVTRHNVQQVEALRAWALDLTGRPLQLMAGITPRDDGDLRPLRESVGADDRARLQAAHGDFAPELREETARGCGAALRGLGVNPYGDVFVCQELRRPLGNVRRDDLGEIWCLHPDLLALRARDPALRPCQGCAVAS